MDDIDLKTLKTLNVLYVEDEREIRDEMFDSINEFFKSFILAENGLDGLEKLKKHSIDLIITDIKMPILDGFEMIKEIRESSEIPIIITSAFNEAKYLQSSIDLGIDGYISKPINLKKLLKRVSKVSSKVVSERLKKELQDINSKLEKKVNEKIEELREKDKIMFEQSKYAQMGEMIDAIAHQWRQPLTVIDILVSSINSPKNKKSQSFCETKSKEIKEQINHLNNTLKEFRNFLRVDKQIDIFSIREVLNSTLILIKDDYKKEQIQIEIDGIVDTKIEAYFNEFKHVILNILNNAKDALVQNRDKDRKIKILVKESKDKTTISISDNAGGIKESIIDNVFQHNFTTKGDNGTGIGLYLSKTIIDKIGATIGVKNIIFDKELNTKGANFEISLKKVN